MTATTSKPVYGADKEGCWLDCCRGFYIGEAIIQTAIVHGFTDNGLPIESPERFADLSDYHELTDEAQDFMQKFAEEGFCFGFSEGGDWGLWASEEDDC